MDNSHASARGALNVGHRIETARFILRTLTLEDATERYVAWFSDPSVSLYIAAARQPQSVATLRAYIEEKATSSAAQLFGIFLRRDGLHIGNIKFEPIRDEVHAAVVGVLIGDPEWRGKGVFREVFLAASDFLRETRGILSFWLGVEQEHAAAFAGYRKAGFAPALPPADLISVRRPDSVYMVCRKK